MELLLYCRRYLFPSLELYVRYHRQLKEPTCIASAFGYDILGVLTLVTRKLQVVCGCFTYQTTALLLEMSIFYVRAGCEIQMAIYAFKHASESLSYKPFVRTYTLNLKITGPIRMFCISNDSSAIQRHSL